VGADVIGLAQYVKQRVALVADQAATMAASAGGSPYA
jgi:hypothetical protein